MICKICGEEIHRPTDSDRPADICGCCLSDAKPVIVAEMNKALAEIGPIEPWWSEEDGMFVFEHAAYPFVLNADPDKEKTRAGYIRALHGFIQERMEGNVAESVDRITSGRGGVRPGAGRKKGSKKEPTARVRIPEDVAAWLQEDPGHLAQVRQLMN